MPNDKLANESTPAPEDAFGELARAGYESVPGAAGEHAERLARMRARVQGGASAKPDATPEPAAPQAPRSSVGDPASPTAKVVRLSPRRLGWLWWGIAAALLALIAVTVWQFAEGPEATPPAVAEREAAPTLPEQDGMAYEPVADDRVQLREEMAGESAVRQPVQPLAGVHDDIGSGAKEASPPPRTPIVERGLPPQTQGGRPTSKQEPETAVARAPEDAAEGGSAPERIAAATPPPRPAAPATTSARVSASPAADAAGAAAVVEDVPLRTDTSVAADVADVSTATAEREADEPTRFSLSRGSISELRRVTGVIADDGGAPLPGAVIEVERTGQRFVVGEDGAFDISLPPAGRVALVTVPDSEDSLYVDLTRSERYDFAWPTKPSPDEVPQIRPGGHSAIAPPLPAPAPPNPVFEAYLDSLDARLGAPVELVFNVNRKGRVTGVRLGPSYEVDRAVFKRARAILEAGPLWGERWRRGKWRVVVD